MKCTTHQALFMGPILGILVFIATMSAGLSNAVLYYASGFWITDLLTPLIAPSGEEYILVGIVFGLVCCMVFTTIYTVLLCKLSRRLSER